MDYTNFYFQPEADQASTQFAFPTNEFPQAAVDAPAAHPTDAESTSDAAYMVPLRREDTLLWTRHRQETLGGVPEFFTGGLRNPQELVDEYAWSSYICDDGPSTPSLLSRWASPLALSQAAHMGPRPSRTVDDFDHYSWQGTLDGVEPHSENVENHAPITDPAPSFFNENSYSLSTLSQGFVAQSFSSRVSSNVQTFTSGIPSAGPSRTADDFDPYRQQGMLSQGLVAQSFSSRFSSNVQTFTSGTPSAGPSRTADDFDPYRQQGMLSQGFVAQYSPRFSSNTSFSLGTPSVPFDPVYPLHAPLDNSPTGGLLSTQKVERVSFEYVKFSQTDSAVTIIGRFPDIFWPKDVPLPDSDEGAEDVEWVFGSDHAKFGSQEVPKRYFEESTRKHFELHKDIAKDLPSYPEEGVAIIVREDTLSDGRTECEVVFFDPQHAPVLLMWHVSMFLACRPPDEHNPNGAASDSESAFQCIYLNPSSGKLCGNQYKDLGGFEKHLSKHAAQERFDIEEKNHNKSQAVLLKDDELVTARFWFCGVCRYVGKTSRYSSFGKHCERKLHIAYSKDVKEKSRFYYETKTKWKEAGRPR